MKLEKKNLNSFYNDPIAIINFVEFLLKIEIVQVGNIHVGVVLPYLNFEAASARYFYFFANYILLFLLKSTNLPLIYFIRDADAFYFMLHFFLIRSKNTFPFQLSPYLMHHPNLVQTCLGLQQLLIAKVRIIAI